LLFPIMLIVIGMGMIFGRSRREWNPQADYS
jgi:hypothetical protein